MVSASYFDGRSTRVRQVSLSVVGEELAVNGEDVYFHVPFASVKVDERLGRAPRRLRFQDGSFCEVREIRGQIDDRRLSRSSKIRRTLADLQAEPTHVRNLEEREAMRKTDPAPSLASLSWISRPDETGTQSRGRRRNRFAPLSDDLRIRIDVWDLRRDGFHAGSEREGK